MAPTPSFSVFTKPWPALPLERLAQHVAELGFAGVELPVRPGFQVPPEEAASRLPQAARIFAAQGLRIFSVASTTDEAIFAACAEAGVPLIRIMAPIGPEGYLRSEQRLRQELQAAERHAARYGVQVGVQQHYGRHVASAIALMRLLEGTDPQHVVAVWDAAHDALAGLEPEYGLEVVWERLGMVNLKNAFYRNRHGPELAPDWHPYFTTGPHGLASWPRVIRYLKQRGYEGVICLTAEYDAQDRVDEFARADLAWARALWESEG
jgi:sugar phosphate isomerase/epimerase